MDDTQGVLRREGFDTKLRAVNKERNNKKQEVQKGRGGLWGLEIGSSVITLERVTFQFS